MMDPTNGIEEESYIPMAVVKSPQSPKNDPVDGSTDSTIAPNTAAGEAAPGMATAAPQDARPINPVLRQKLTLQQQQRAGSGAVPTGPMEDTGNGSSSSPTMPSYAERNPAYTRHKATLDDMFSAIRKEFLDVDETTLSMNERDFPTSLRYPTRNRYTNILAYERSLFPRPGPDPADTHDSNGCSEADGRGTATDSAERRGRSDPPQPVFSSTKEVRVAKPSTSGGGGGVGGSFTLRRLFGKGKSSSAPPPTSQPQSPKQQQAATRAQPPFPYINGNLVELDGVEPTFVACQAPLPHTLEDFYQTIWQNRISLVIMVTGCLENGMIKADRYWPPDESDVQLERRIWQPLSSRWLMYEMEMNAADGSGSDNSSGRSIGSDHSLPGDMLNRNFGENVVKGSLEFGDLVVTKDANAAYSFDAELKLQFRPLIVQPKSYLAGKQGENAPPPLKVLQVQYTGWPDHGVPTSTDSFNALIKLIGDNVESWSARHTGTDTRPPPVLVHCSAGIGRTGSLIGAYAILQLMRSGRLVDSSMVNVLRQMRRCRYGMVQRIEQYMYMYEFILKNMGYSNLAQYQANVPRQAEMYNAQFIASMRARNTTR